MSKKSTEEQTESAPELRKFFVPGHGEVEAKDEADVATQLEKLKKKDEAGDGDK